MNYSNSNSINSQINSTRSEYELSMSDTDSNVNRYYVEDRTDAIFFDNIDTFELKKKWLSMNMVLRDKLNCDECLSEIREKFFIELPKTYKLAIDVEIGKKGKQRLLEDLDYVFCDDLSSIFSVIITDSASATTAFRLFHLSFHSIRPKAKQIDDRLRPNIKNMVCTRFERVPEAVDAALAADVAAVEEESEGAIHIKIDNLVYLGTKQPRLDDKETLFKRIVFNEDTEKLEYLTEKFGKEDSINLDSYVSKSSIGNLIKYIDIVIRDLDTQLNKAKKQKKETEIARLEAIIAKKNDNKTNLIPILLQKSRENIHLLKVISLQVLLSFNENLSDVLR